jgi:TonB family protein
MKNTLITLLFSSVFATGFSQDLSYDVRVRYTHPVLMEKLNDAQLLSDFIADYPTNWVNDYASVEISATNAGKTMKAFGMNQTLNSTQKDILKKADLGTDIVIDVAYKYKNSVTNNIENRSMHVSMTLVPEVEAAFVGGYQQLTKYLKETVINQISETIPKEFQAGIVIFTINEQGEIANSQISKTSGDTKTDKLLLEAINNMPKWKPAENSKGIKVKQQFAFNVGRVGKGGC